MISFNDDNSVNEGISENTIRKLEQLVNLKELQIELVDTLGAAIMWIINYSEKTGLIIPNLEGLQHLIHKIDKLMQYFYPQDIPDESLQSDKNRENRRRLDKTLNSNPFIGENIFPIWNYIF